LAAFITTMSGFRFSVHTADHHQQRRFLCMRSFVRTITKYLILYFPPPIRMT
jgi:hypothetical protein